MDVESDSQLGKAVLHMTFLGMNFVKERVDNPPRVALSPRVPKTDRFGKPRPFHKSYISYSKLQYA